MEDGLTEVVIDQSLLVLFILHREVRAVDEDAVRDREEVNDVVDVAQKGDLGCLQQGVKATTPGWARGRWGREVVRGVLV